MLWSRGGMRRGKYGSDLEPCDDIGQSIGMIVAETSLGKSRVAAACSVRPVESTRMTPSVAARRQAEMVAFIDQRH